MPERGLLLRRWLMAAGHNALGRSGPGQKHAVAKLHWLKWGVLVSGSTGSCALFVTCPFQPPEREGCPRVSQVACVTGSL